MRPLAVLVVGILAACASADADRDSTLVAVTVELRQIYDSASMDSSAKAVARSQVLQRRGLTVAAYERMMRELADDPDRATRLWEVVEEQVGGREGRARAPAERPRRAQ